MSTNGSVYRICFPPSWNGEMVLYAHGYVPSSWPVAIPDDDIGGLKISDLVMSAGYGYAATSYRANGVVVLDAAQDVLDLEAEVRRLYKPDPMRVWLIGVSLGSLIAALDLEQHPERFAGAVAVCGPIGDFQRLLNHLGDFRAVFDYFYPGVLPGTAINVPDSLSWQWAERFSPIVRSAVMAEPGKAVQVLTVTGTPAGTDAATAIRTVDEVLQLHSSFVPDAQRQSGGQPYDNRATAYSGSDDDAKLNAGIPRYDADPAGRAGIDALQTSGMLSAPMVVLHTTGDPIVPIVQESLYVAKVGQAKRAEHLQVVEVERYGHCEFSAGEMQAGFRALLNAGR